LRLARRSRGVVLGMTTLVLSPIFALTLASSTQSVAGTIAVSRTEAGAPTRTPSPPPTPTPPPSGWPGPSNTGVPAGTVLTPSGSITVTTNGTVLNALNITGFVDIRANNVTIKNSRIRNGSAAWEQVRVEPGTSGALIEDTEIDGQNTNFSGTPDDGYNVGGTGGYTLLRDNLHNNVVGAGAGGGGARVTIQNSWIHDIHKTTASHNENIISTGAAAGITITHNRFDNQINEVATIALLGQASAIQNVTVDNNLLNGGGFTVYGGCNPADASGLLCQNIAITNNRFMRTPQPGAFWTTGGSFGPITAFNGKAVGTFGVDPTFRAAHSLTWSGNVWDDSGVLIGL
jgi:hypothetical protein